MATRPKLPLREIVMFGLQVVMGPLPNIEPVSLMVMLFAVVFGWKGLYPTYVFVVMEILFYGIGGWAMYYLYIWLVLFVAARLMRDMEHPLGWAILSGAFGLLFGALCAIMDVVIGGLGYAVSKWASGITFDLAHCVGNFAIALVLFVPLRKLFAKLNR